MANQFTGNITSSNCTLRQYHSRMMPQSYQITRLKKNTKSLTDHKEIPISMSDGCLGFFFKTPWWHLNTLVQTNNQQELNNINLYTKLPSTTQEQYDEQCQRLCQQRLQRSSALRLHGYACNWIIGVIMCPQN